LPLSFVVFDVEGVLIPKRRFLLFEVSRVHGVRAFVKLLLVGVLYSMGVVSLERSLSVIFRSLRGTRVEDLSRLFRGVPLMPGAEELFVDLRARGLRTALISSGLPDFLVADLAGRLGADYSSGIGVGVSDGVLTGEISGDVISRRGKVAALEKILKVEGVSAEECAVVVDDLNNLQLLGVCGLSVGFNPDYVIGSRADYVVKEDLSEIPSIVASGVVKGRRVSRSNLVRELIHASGFLIPFLCIYLLSNLVVAELLFAAIVVYASAELLRIFGVEVPVVSRVTLWAADRSELHEFNTAPIFHAAGIAFSLIVFPVSVGYAAIAVHTLGDSSASLVGKRWGSVRIPYNRGKSVEGSLVGMLFAFLGAVVFVDPVTAAVGALAGISVESLPLPLDDNLLVPLAAGVAMWLL
jgi:dolichol kinase/phosphoserine phosphatase